MKEKLNSEEMNYVSGGYGSDGPRISCGEAKDIAWKYIYEEWNPTLSKGIPF